MSHFYLQRFLSLILLRVVSGCRDTDTVSAVQEEDVALSCFSPNDTDPNGCYRYKWTKYATDTSEVTVIFKWPNRDKDVKHVKWEADGNGQMCLFLRKSQKSDEGLYTCEMWQGWDRLMAKNISLKVKECKTVQALQAAPSTSVKLNCPISKTLGQQGPQNISWAMQKGNNRISVDSKRATANGTSLAFRSVITTDSGWYRCNYTLGQIQRCFETYLHVQEGNGFVATMVPVVATKTESLQAPTASETALINREEESSETLIAVVVSVILGIIIIAALIGLFMHRRRKTQRMTQSPHRTFEGNHMPVYEIVSPSECECQDSANQRVNSLYQNQEGSLCTFQY